MNTNTTAVLALVREYGDMRARYGARPSAYANELLDRIAELLGPDPVALATRYESGESITMIARTTGLSYATVRTTLIRAGVEMRSPGRHNGTHYPNGATK